MVKFEFSVFVASVIHAERHNIFSPVSCNYVFYPPDIGKSEEDSFKVMLRNWCIT